MTNGKRKRGPERPGEKPRDTKYITTSPFPILKKRSGGKRAETCLFSEAGFTVRKFPRIQSLETKTEQCWVVEDGSSDTDMQPPDGDGRYGVHAFPTSSRAFSIRAGTPRLWIRVEEEECLLESENYYDFEEANKEVFHQKKKFDTPIVGGYGETPAQNPPFWFHRSSSFSTSSPLLLAMGFVQSFFRWDQEPVSKEPVGFVKGDIVSEEFIGTKSSHPAGQKGCSYVRLMKFEGFPVLIRSSGAV